MYRLALIALLIVLAAPDGARSVQPDEMLKDPAPEARPVICRASYVVWFAETID